MSILKLLIFTDNLGEHWLVMPPILNLGSFEEFNQWCQVKEIDICIKAV